MQGKRCSSSWPVNSLRQRMNDMPDTDVQFRRLVPGDRRDAVTLFETMSQVFEEQRSPVSPAYTDQLLASPEFYAIAAMSDSRIIGGLTAHVIPMTRNESRELFIYDLAVVPDWRRKGVGSGLIGKARELAAQEGVHVAFVMADADDDHAIEFYRSTPATASHAVVFTLVHSTTRLNTIRDSPSSGPALRDE